MEFPDFCNYKVEAVAKIDMNIGGSLHESIIF